jgi:putative holliday junction resolvase
MPANVIAIDKLPEHLKRNDRLMGLDLGTKTIGLAVSDAERSIAAPLKTIMRSKFTQDAAEMLQTAERLGVVALIVGLPLNMDGSEGPRCQATHAFVRALAPLSALHVVFWDERMSTIAAERMLIEADLSRAKRKAVIDAAAAAYILQGALDRLRQLMRS